MEQSSPESTSGSAVSPEHQAAVQELEAMVLAKAASEAHVAAQKMPEKNSGHFGTESDRRRDDASVKGRKAEALAEISDVVPEAANEAIQLADDVKGDYERQDIFKDLVPMAIATGNVEACLQKLEDDRFGQEKFLATVATQHAKIGQIDEAIATASRIQSVYTRCGILSSFLAEHPEQASAIHQAVLIDHEDTSEKEANSSSRFRSLTELAEYIPEAAEQAAAMADSVSISYDDDFQALARLSEYRPEFGVRLAEGVQAHAKRFDRTFMSNSEHDQAHKRRQFVTETAQHLAEAGQIDEAVKMLEMSPRVGREGTANFIKAAIEAGRVDAAVRIAQLDGELLVASTYAESIHLISDPEMRKEALDAIRATDGKYGRGLNIVKAALNSPDLLPEAEAAIEALSSHFDKEDALKELAPVLIQAGRLDEVLARVQEQGGGLGIIRSLDTSSPEGFAAALEIARTLKGEARAEALSNLVEHDPELVKEIVQVFDGEMAPQLQTDMQKYKDRDRSWPPAHESLISIVHNLHKAGLADEAMHIADGATTANGYVRAAMLLAADRPESIPRLIRSLDGMRSDERFDVSKQLEGLIERLPDESLRVIVEGLENSENTSLRLVAASAMEGRLLEAGRFDELLRVLPGELSGHIALSMKNAISQMVEAGNIDGAREIVSRVKERSYRLALIQPLVSANPELAHDVNEILEADPSDDERKKLYGDERLFALGAIAPHIPGAADKCLEELRQRVKLNASGTHRNFKNEDVDLVLNGLITAGRGQEVMELLKGTYYFEARSSNDVIIALLPTLMENGEPGLALQYARSIKEPGDGAKALARVAAAGSTQGSPKGLEELIGSGADEATPHSKSDRSINHRFFAEDIANNPLLIEAFMARATNPAEIIAILKTVDQAAAGSENGESLQLQALHMLKHFDSVEVLTESWKQERQDQALGLGRADHESYKYLPNLQQLSRNIESNTAGVVSSLLRGGYTAGALCEHPWLISPDIANIDDTERFPFDGSKVRQQEWLADHAFVQLEGFSRRGIGQILANRLANNQEYSLHDASQWLRTFQVTAEREVYNPETGQTEIRRLKDTADEALFLSKLMNGNFSAEELRRLPGFASAGGEAAELKTQKFDQLFADPHHTLIYAAIIQSLASTDTGRVNQAAVEALIDEWTDRGIIKHWVGQGKEILNTENLSTAVQIKSKLVSIMSVAGESEEKIPVVLGRLRNVSKARKEYVDSTTTWLRTYQNLPSQKLERVWGERAAALADGTEDHPTSIYEWSLSSGLREYLAREAGPNGMLQGDIPTKELLSRYSKFLPELVTRYGTESTVDALTFLWRDHNTEADLPPYSIDLADGYTFKVFSKDDPAGMTIGFDTDCCMTLGGVSHSCIEAGYSDPRFGFVGLYDDQGKLAAQSFVWHNEGVLVLDNIEGQRGRSLEKIQGQYREALEEYLLRLVAEKPELGIEQVNLGTGYLASQLSQGLVQAEAVPVPKTDRRIYSDATTQLEMLRLDPEAVRSVKESTEPTEPPPTTAIESQPVRSASPEIIAVPSAAEGAEIMSRIEAQVYPSELVLGQEELHSDLQRPHNYSFMIGSRTGNSGIVGYMVAYRDRDEVYVSDLALLPDEQKAGYGAAALDHLLSRVSQAGEQRVVFEARETTSYPALLSHTAAEILERHGFQIAGQERLANHFENGEAVYRVALSPIA